MNTKDLGIESYDIKRRQDTISETWSWCLHLVSGITFAGASISYEQAVESIQKYAREVA
jgi:hypothetical protein